MKKLMLIGFKDLKLAFRDPSALVMMLLAPFLLTIGLGFVTGRLSGSGGSGLSNISVVLVDQDGGELGAALVEMFNSTELEGLVAPVTVSDPAAARQMVEDDQAAAAVIVPPGFSDSIIPAEGSAQTGPVVQIELYANPTAPTSSGVIRTILEQFLSQVEVGRAAGQVMVTQLITSGRIAVQDAASVGAQAGARMAAEMKADPAITLARESNDGAAIEFDVLAYMAPGMALMFLMFTTSYGGRALLAERRLGTLPRLLVTPTSSPQVLGGKVLGIFLTGAAQMLILIVASAVLFQLRWGDSLGVLALVLAAVIAASGWGMLITAFAKTPGQVQWVGTALMLVFGLLGGSFIDPSAMPGWLRVISKITPNAWGLDGFATLAQGGSLADVLTPVLALLAMGALLFTAAALSFNRNKIIQR
jgi:ABC-2 type transport system permease protein